MASVVISFECTPLRSIARWDFPLDASAEQIDHCMAMRRAAEKHGAHNSYYLSGGRCEFQLTNDPDLGLLSFDFEGTVLTDESDQRTRRADLSITLAAETCDWLTAQAVAWFQETVVRAVRVEFDRYIDSGDLERTRQRLARTQADLQSGGGFVGMGL